MDPAPQPQSVASTRRLVIAGIVATVASIVVELTLEWRHAQAALEAWVCDKGTVPLPAGPSACSAGFILHWMLARLPLYVGIVALAMLVLEACLVAWRAARRTAPLSVSAAGALRFVALAVGLLALAELVACAGETTCSLSLTCT